MQNYVNVTHFWNFGTPSIFETIEARNFKFGIELDDSLYYVCMYVCRFVTRSPYSLSSHEARKTRTNHVV